MKFLKAALVATALTGFAASANAQDTGNYINVGIDAYEFDAYGISGKFGHKFTPVFGVEAQGSFGIIDDKETIGGVEVKSNVDYSLGAFAIARLPASENFNLFGRVGYHYTEGSSKSGNVKVSADADGIAFGAGGEYSWDGVSGIRAEYTNLDGDGGSADVWTVSYVRNF